MTRAGAGGTENSGGAASTAAASGTGGTVSAGGEENVGSSGDKGADQGLSSTVNPAAAVRSLNHVALGVRDLQAALRFYVEGLGLRKTLEKPTSDLTPALMRLPAGTTGTTVFVQGDSRVGQLELVKWELPENDGGHPKRPGDFGVGQLSFPVAAQDIAEIHARLVKMGYEVYSEPTTTVVKNYGPVTLFLCEDPDGTQVELVALPTAEEVRAFRAQAAQTPAREEGGSR